MKYYIETLIIPASEETKKYINREYSLMLHSQPYDDIDQNYKMNETIAHFLKLYPNAKYKAEIVERYL